MEKSTKKKKVITQIIFVSSCTQQAILDVGGIMLPACMRAQHKTRYKIDMSNISSLENLGLVHPSAYMHK